MPNILEPYLPEKPQGMGEVGGVPPVPPMSLQDILSSQTQESESDPAMMMTAANVAQPPPPDTFSGAVIEKVNESVFGYPRSLIAAGMGALAGGVSAGPIGAAIGAGIGLLSDVAGAIAGTGIQTMYPEGIQTPIGPVSANALGIGTDIVTGLLTGMGGFQALPKLVRGGTGLAQGAGKLKPEDVGRLTKMISLSLSEVLPEGMTGAEIARIAPKTLKGWWEAHPEHRALIRKLNRGEPVDWDSPALGVASTKQDILSRGMTAGTVIPDTLGAYKGPELWRAKERISDKIGDWIKLGILRPISAPSFAMHGEWASEQMLNMLRGIETSDHALYARLMKKLDSVLAPLSENEQSWLMKFMHEREGVSGVKAAKELSKTRDIEYANLVSGESLEVPAYRPTPPTREQMLADLQKAGKGNMADAMNHILDTSEHGILPELVEREMLKPEDAIPNFLTRVHAQKWIASSEVKLVESGKGGWFRPHTIDNMVPQEWRAYFLEPRTSDVIPQGLTLRDKLSIQYRAYSHLVTRDSAMPIVQELMSGIQNPLRQRYASELFNYFIGRNPTKEYMGNAAAALIKDYNFLRTISGSLLTPLVNLTQRFNVLGQVGYKNWIMGHLSNPALDNLAESLGLLRVGQGVMGPASSGGALTPDVGSQTLQWLHNGVRGMNKIAGGLFFLTERQNILHAFRSGMMEALDAGRPIQEAVMFARNLVDQTQFTTRVGRTPLGMYNDLGSLLGQFRTYNLNQMGYLANLWRSNPRGAIRMIGTGLALFGPSAVLMGEPDLAVTRHLLGQPFKVQGAAQELGIQLAPMMSMMGFSDEDLTHFTQYLPGPAVAGLQDAAAAITGRGMGRGLDMENLFMPLTPEQRTASLTRLLPLGSQLNRLRRLLADVHTGADREALTTSEAIGLTARTGPLRHAQVTDSQAMMRFFGLQPPKFYNQDRMMEHWRELGDKYKEIQSRIVDLRMRGYNEDANALSRWFMRWNPEVRYMILQQSGLQAGLERQVWEPHWRQAWNTPISYRMSALKSVAQPALRPFSSIGELLTAK